MKNLIKNLPIVVGIGFCTIITSMLIKDVGRITECTDKPLSVLATFYGAAFVWGLFAVGVWAGMEYEHDEQRNAWDIKVHDEEVYQDWMEDMAINEDNKTTYKQWLEQGYLNSRNRLGSKI